MSRPNHYLRDAHLFDSQPLSLHSLIDISLDPHQDELAAADDDGGLPPTVRKWVDERQTNFDPNIGDGLGESSLPYEGSSAQYLG
jgi:hypothetical protein